MCMGCRMYRYNMDGSWRTSSRSLQELESRSSSKQYGPGWAVGWPQAGMSWRYGESDEQWYGKWLAEAFLRCARTASGGVHLLFYFLTFLKADLDTLGSISERLPRRSVLAAKESNLRGVIMTGNR